jgi:hypothetical protein
MVVLLIVNLKNKKYDNFVIKFAFIGNNNITIAHEKVKFYFTFFFTIII